jgi:lysozyme
MRKCSAAGIDLIKRSEGLRLTSYRCPAGVLTIGYGHTGPDVPPGLTITPDYADALFRGDLERAERAVNDLVTVPLLQGQFDALCDFVFNLGENALRKSTLLKMLNRQDYTSAGHQLIKWVYVKGEVSKGLLRRRTDARDLWFSPRKGIS